MVHVLGQFHFTGKVSAMFDNYRKLSGKYEVKLTIINGGKPPTPINTFKKKICLQNNRKKYGV